MLQIIVFSILMASSSYEKENDFRNITRIVGSVLCPYTNFCHLNASAELENTTKYEPCCSTCSCDDSCYETMTCCPDKEDVATRYAEMAPVGAVCKRSASKLKVGYEHVTDTSAPYLVIDTCPKNNSKPRLNNKCKGIRKMNLEDYVWVSDKETKHIYQNVYCAICHGVTVWIPWKVRTTCKDVITADFDSAVELLLSPACDIINEEPEDSQTHIRKLKCYIFSEYILDTYGGCKMSGNMAQYNNITRAACETVNLPFYQISPRTTLISEEFNMFCQACNRHPSSWDFYDTVCPKRGNDSAEKSGLHGFSTLINFVQLKSDQEKFACGISEAFDQVQHRCRRLYCPIGQAPHNGRCEKLLQSAIGLSVYFLYQLDIVWEDNKLIFGSLEDGLDIEQLLITVKSELSDRIGLDKCSPCYYDLCVFKEKLFKPHSIPGTLVNESQSVNASSHKSGQAFQGVLFSIQITTLIDCPFDDIAERAIAIVDTVVSISYNGENILFLVSLRDVNQTEANREHQRDCFDGTLQSGIRNRITCSNPEAIITKKPCPEYLLDYTELKALQAGTETILIEHTLNTLTVNKNNETMICVDEYNKIMSLKNGSSSFWNDFYTFTVHCLLVSMANNVVNDICSVFIMLININN